ncbi:putative F-box domain-containing protein [Helianthus annuus]|uniref:F-box domain-containing protein n=1 Tax=Helianthus annuus TaxID=4232 RepID=A0A251SQ91_HELAN|nr:putative F-box protein At3g52320 [Helianthus annuus]KAF5764856.1 putative F-box domain-containing protein [Helianthus annuus]KAJ0451485.1 putative F-box domain-containing protein [Helianthus annuus]KAJ0456018.1 putative F-box domain-containing protein [Helianthus annuus]KAJ0473363.1 putative F-box domain-containing protein [Helianthus annuus]KAJ0648947.1 putative F-box domain-containing protein [Helianthus annuus]
MSDHIPFELQSEIMKRFPAKSLIRFRSVCKAWKSLIESSDFITHYSGQQHLIVRSLNSSETNYVSIVDDDHTFPHQKVSVTFPPLLKNPKDPSIIRSSHGLLCFYDSYPPGGRAVIWNPSIRKSVVVDVPPSGNYVRTVVGFGVCHQTMDPKILKITRTTSLSPWQTEVFTLSTRAWRSLSSGDFPRKSICMYWSQVVVDGCLYWLARDSITVDGKVTTYDLIISFDLTSEEFGEVNLPFRLAHPHCNLFMYKLRESLVVIKLSPKVHKQAHHVWMLEKDGVTKSFIKLYTITSQSPDISIPYVRGFRKTGEPLTEVVLHSGSTRILAAYEPYSKSITNLGINGRHFFVESDYMETLLLL